jgi:hypothetical protein
VTEPAAGAPAPDDPADPANRCPWCSTPLATGVTRCAACGAAVGGPDGGGSEPAEIPGVTQVDPVLGLRRRAARPNRLVGWLADIDSEPLTTDDTRPLDAAARGGAQVLEGAGRGSVAPPPPEVRREMARLELEALRAELEGLRAEDAHPVADAGASGGADPVAGPGDPSPDAPARAEGDADR